MKAEEFISGLLPDTKDERDILLGNYLIPYKLPSVISWKDINIPVKDQGNKPYCSGFAGAGMKEIQERLDHNTIYSFSGDWLYHECKKIDGSPNEQGTYIRAAMKVLQNKGMYHRLNNKDFYFPIEAYARVNNLEELKVAVVSTGPLCIGVPVYKNWFKDYVINAPGPEENELGGHAILVTGYDDNKQLVEFKNSWGSSWGEQGYGYLTYRYINNLMESAWSAVDLHDKLTGYFVNQKKIRSRLYQVYHS